MNASLFDPCNQIRQERQNKLLELEELFVKRIN